MAKNLNRTRNAQLIIAAAVAAGTASGDVVLIGASGLKGYAHTDRATTATIASGAAAPGLLDGQASVELIGVSVSVNLTVAGGVALGDKIYKVTADGTYSKTAAGGTFIGYALAAIADGVKGPVGLTNA